jgi:hypothetical protein
LPGQLILYAGRVSFPAHNHKGLLSLNKITKFIYMMTLIKQLFFTQLSGKPMILITCGKTTMAGMYGDRYAASQPVTRFDLEDPTHLARLE